MDKITGSDLQEELDMLKELVDKIQWKDRWDRYDEYKDDYSLDVLEQISEAKMTIRRLLITIN